MTEPAKILQLCNNLTKSTASSEPGKGTLSQYNGNVSMSSQDNNNYLIQNNQRLEKEVRKRQRIAEAWREMSGQYAAIIGALDSLIYIASPDYEIEFVNQRLVEGIGKHPLGHKCYKIFYLLDRRCPWCAMDKALGGETVRLQVKGQDRQNNFLIMNTPIHYPDGLIYMLTMVQPLRTHEDFHYLVTHQDSYKIAELLGQYSRTCKVNG